jgi:lipoyl(octanoyl) transferase
MVRELVTRIEQAVIETLAAYNLAGERKAGAPGIYVAPGLAAGPHAGAKIAALGLKIRNGCSYHGVSLNVNMDLQPFLAINPCGYAGLETVDMATLGASAATTDVARTLAACLTANIDGVLRGAAQSQAGAATA